MCLNFCVRLVESGRPCMFRESLAVIVRAHRPTIHQQHQRGQSSPSFLVANALASAKPLLPRDSPVIRGMVNVKIVRSIAQPPFGQSSDPFVPDQHP